MLLHSIKSIYC